MNYFEKMCHLTQYRPKTTLWNEITFVEKSFPEELTRKLEYLIDRCKDNKERGTELTLILNWKTWQHSENNNILMAKFYREYWKKIDNYICDNWRGDKLSYFLRETD